MKDKYSDTQNWVLAKGKLLYSRSFVRMTIVLNDI